MGYTKDYRVNYFYAHPRGNPTAKSVTGVYVAPYREAAFAKAEEIMRNGERNEIPTGVEIIHVNPDNGGSRSVIHFAGERVTPATRWEVALYPSAVNKTPGTVICDRYEPARNELEAREVASNFARTDQGVASIYRVVKVNGRKQREQVAVIVPPHRDEIAEAHRINDALDATAVTHPATADEIDEANTMNEARGDARPAPATEPLDPRECWATDLEQAAKVAKDMGGDLGGPLALLLEMAAAHGRQGAIKGMLGVRFRQVVDALNGVAEKRAAAPRVLLSLDGTLAAIEREPEHPGNGRFRVTNGGRYQAEHVAGWTELSVI
jgi:hypothetical protein